MRLREIEEERERDRDRKTERRREREVCGSGKSRKEGGRWSARPAEEAWSGLRFAPVFNV